MDIERAGQNAECTATEWRRKQALADSLSVTTMILSPYKCLSILVRVIFRRSQSLHYVHMPQTYEAFT